MKQPKIEKARAVLRLATEALVPIETLAREMHISRDSVRRWGLRGRRGIHLDIVEREGQGWFSSREALKRFQEQSQKLEVRL